MGERVAWAIFVWALAMSEWGGVEGTVLGVYSRYRIQPLGCRAWGVGISWHETWIWGRRFGVLGWLGTNQPGVGRVQGVGGPRQMWRDGLGSLGGAIGVSGRERGVKSRSVGPPP